jgi:hypothetical protein
LNVPWFADVFSKWKVGFVLKPKPGSRDFRRLGGFYANDDMTRSRTFAWGTVSVILRPYGGDDGKPGVEFYAHDKEGSLRRLYVAGNEKVARRRVLRLKQMQRFREPRAWAEQRKVEARQIRQERRLKDYFTRRGAGWRALARAGVSRVRVDFSGSGDSGGIDGIETTDAKGAAVEMSSTLREEVEAAFYARFPYSFDNEGCSGSFEVDVTARTAEGRVELPTTYTERIEYTKPLKEDP